MLVTAVEGDLSGAIKQFRLAEKYGFRYFSRMKLLGVFDYQDNILNGLTELVEFKEIVDSTKQGNAKTLANVRETRRHAFEPGCYRTRSLLANVERGCPFPISDDLVLGN